MPNLLGSLLDKFRRDERGAMLVEMTLITPLMISLSAGVFEFGNLIEKKLLIEAGLRDAARYTARCKQSFSGVDCQTVAANIAATATVDGTGTPRVSGWSAANVTVQPTYLTVPITTDGSGNQNYRSSDANVYTVRVSTSFTYTGVSLLAYLGIGPITLTGAHEERYIGW
ncbi:MAG: pilus assembly protein [Mesorhizobium sp.]|nr:MAG: pilus assembly protein [Mesorhizobium sp.]